MNKKKIEFNEFDIAVGSRIRSQREKLGYSREKLAEFADMSINYLGEVERGVRKISAYKLARLSVALGVTTDYLLFSVRHGEKYEPSINFLRVEFESIIEKFIKVVGFEEH
ncbi:MAG: helix-turn-helix transcriptional regulator [Defluviitaleaceae bacterium]|nr:helix-turn-helix transcriptional regulator [Defluviitaleaceae bacterium]